MNRKIHAAFLLSLSLAGCGGGGTSSSPGTVVTPPDTTLPTFAVLSSTLADAATGVPRNSSFGATFSVAVDPKTITGANIKLLGPEGNNISVTPILNSTDLQLLPSLFGLPGNTKYTVSLGAAITDISGRALATPYTRTFTTAAQSWRATTTTVALLPYFSGGVQPAAIVDKAGNVIAVWHHAVAGRETIFSSRMDGKTGIWSPPSTVYVTAGGAADAGAGNVNLVSNMDGDTYLSWTVYAFGTAGETTQLAHYVAASNTWVPSFKVDAVPGHSSLLIDSAGNLTFIGVADTLGLFAMRLDTKTASWGSTHRLENPLMGNYFSGRDMVIDNDGNITVAWLQNYMLYTARYSIASDTWSAPYKLESGLLITQPKLFSITADGKGVVTIAWSHYDGPNTVPSINASRFDPAVGSWTVPAQLSGGKVSDSAYLPTTVSDSAGYSTVVWVQSDGLYSSRYSPAAAVWSAPLRITPSGMWGGNDAPIVAVDPVGNVTATFVPTFPDSQARAIQYLATDGQWHSPVIIDGLANGTSSYPNLPVMVVDKSGTITAVWLENTLIGNTSQGMVVSNRFQ